MSRWFRHYAGMMRDEKLVRAAVRSKQPVERVVWVWGAILESAAEIDNDGHYEFDAAEAAYFLRTDEADICAIEAALGDAGRLAEGRVVKWNSRQYQSDRSKDRQARYRDNQRRRQGSDAESSGDDETVTVEVRHRDGEVTPQITETDTDKTSSLRSEVGARAPEKPARTKSKGSRIPENWEPDWDCAKALGVPPHRQQAVSDKFRDYWRGKPGKDGVKVDWPATWRNWCRTECERNGWHPPVAAVNAVARPPPPGDFIEYDSSLWHELAGAMRQNGRIMPAAIYTLHGKRGAYVDRSRLSRGQGEAA